jgi:hypothetical protein
LANAALTATHAEVTTEKPSHQLYFYWNADGTAPWNPATIAGPGTTYPAPAMVRNTGSTEVTAQG